MNFVSKTPFNAFGNGNFPSTFWFRLLLSFLDKCKKKHKNIPIEQLMILMEYWSYGTVHMLSCFSCHLRMNKRRWIKTWQTNEKFMNISFIRIIHQHILILPNKKKWVLILKDTSTPTTKQYADMQNIHNAHTHTFHVVGNVVCSVVWNGTTITIIKF